MSPNTCIERTSSGKLLLPAASVGFRAAKPALIKFRSGSDAAIARVSDRRFRPTAVARACHVERQLLTADSTGRCNTLIAA
jgi:hypothetical protein